MQEEKQKEDTAQQQTEDDLSESKPASDEASVSNVAAFCTDFDNTAVSGNK